MAHHPGHWQKITWSALRLSWVLHNSTSLAPLSPGWGFPACHKPKASSRVQGCASLHAKHFAGPSVALAKDLTHGDECGNANTSCSHTPCFTIHHVKGTGLLPSYFPCQEQMYIRLLIKQQPSCTRTRFEPTRTF